MSTPKKHEVTTIKPMSNRQLLFRLKRLPITHQMKIETFIAYVGLQMVNHGKVVDYERAMKIIKKCHLDEKLTEVSPIPCNNILEAMIFLVVFKRKLLEREFFNNPELDVWNDELTAPIFDIMYEISKVYKI